MDDFIMAFFDVFFYSVLFDMSIFDDVTNFMGRMRSRFLYMFNILMDNFLGVINNFFCFVFNIFPGLFSCFRSYKIPAATPTVAAAPTPTASFFAFFALCFFFLSLPAKSSNSLIIIITFFRIQTTHLCLTTLFVLFLLLGLFLQWFPCRYRCKSLDTGQRYN